jgi:uncharacterized protein YjbI with pentapeptide repeats
MIQIKHRFTEAVLCEFDVPTLNDAVVKAVSIGVDLYGADLREANLHEANFYGANLYGADLRGANLHGANLRNADLHEADLRNANLHGADLRKANLHGANFCGANLHGAKLYGADLHGANLYGADLHGADLRGEKIAITPILIGGLRWAVCISESFLEIGCQRHEHKVWADFNEDTIAEMDRDSSEFWNSNKSWLLAACKSHKKQSLAYRKAKN